MRLFDMKKQREEALNKAESIITAAENSQRPMTASESKDVNALMAEADALNPQIASIERQNTIRAMIPNGQFIAETRGFFGAVSGHRSGSASLSPEYSQALHAHLSSGGKVTLEELSSGADGSGGFLVPGSERFTQQRLANGSIAKVSAAMYEGAGGGSDGAGGYAVSIPTEQQIVPLAMPDLGIFDASMIVPTATDVKIPQQTAFGTSVLKSESSGTIATFGGTDPTLGQITLSAYMAGALRLVSWELMQDVKTFQEFIVSDLLNAQRILEGQLLATGTGTGEAQGVFGNTGNGTGSAYELTGAASDSALLLQSLFDVTATLKAGYQPNACWIMSRATGLAIRKAQMQANLYVPVVTTDPDGTERILGKPVFYDVNAPALPTATSAGVTPILFGDFKQGYIIGVRGGAGINVKVLDQTWAAQGQLGILAYRRLDGRIRRSEAIQSIAISHS